MIRRLAKHALDILQDKTDGASRSANWPKVRDAHLALNPACVVCGGTKSVEVHHIKPFHLFPALELEATNFVSLCEAGKYGINCHLAFGHLGNFRWYNPEVVTDALRWFKKIKEAHNK